MNIQRKLFTWLRLKLQKNELDYLLDNLAQGKTLTKLQADRAEYLAQVWYWK